MRKMEIEREIPKKFKVCNIRHHLLDMLAYSFNFYECRLKIIEKLGSLFSANHLFNFLRQKFMDFWTFSISEKILSLLHVDFCNSD